MDHRCTNPACAQHRKLTITSFSKSQGCTHYCNICGWGYWTHDVPPDQATVDEVIKVNPKLSILQIKEALTVEVLKPVPPGEWGKGARKRMHEHLGKFQPFWMSAKAKKFWAAKYLKEYGPPEPEKK